MVDYSLKAKVIESGLTILERKFSKMTFLKSIESDEKMPLSEEEYEALYELWTRDEEAHNLIKEAHKVNNASYKRRKRLAMRITLMMLLGDCIFLTLTFKDDILNNTSKETRRRYVSRFLKSHSDWYVANIDYGSINHREHYHAVIKCDKVDNTAWPYGSIDFERVKVSDNSSKRLAKYVCKLTNHAIKETTKRNYCIYSRNQGA